MNDPKVQIAIEAKATGSFAAEFGKISAQAKQAGDRIRSSMSGIQGAAAALGVGLSVAGFTAFIKSTIDAADKLNDLAKVTGVSATTLGGIGFAAQQAGADLDGVAKAFGKLNLNIADALAGNSEAVETFRKLGLSVAELRNLKGDEVLVRLANTFASFEDDANKAAGANAVFGKSFQSILPLLDEGGESLRKNIGYYARYSGVTSDLVQKSDAFNDALTKLQLLNRAFGNQLATALLPSLQKLVEYLVEAKEKSTGFKEAAGDVAESLKYLVKFAVAGAFAFKDFGQFLGSIAGQAVALGKLDFAAVIGIGDDFDAKMERSKAQLGEIRKIIDGIGSSQGDGFHRSPIPLALPNRRGRAPNFGNAGAGAQAAKAGADDYARALENVAKMAADADLELAAMFSTQEITGAQKALAALTSSDEWKKFTGPQQADLTSRLQAIDAIQRETLEWKKKNEEQEKSIRLFQEQQAQQQQAVEAFTSNLGQYAEENGILERQIALVGQDDLARQKLAETIEFERLKKQALLADDQAGLAILEEQFRKRIALTEQLAEATAKFGEIQKINSVFADAFGDALLDVVNGTKSLKDAFKDMERDIVRGLNQIAINGLKKALFGGDGSGGLDFGSLLAKLFGSLGSLFGGGGGLGYGTIGSNIPAGPYPYANGTGFHPGGMALVGERGPELLRLPRGSQVYPNDFLRAQAGRDRELTIVQTINVMPGADTRSARQAAAKLRDATVLAIKDR